MRTIAVILLVVVATSVAPPRQSASGFLDQHLLITWYGNPRTPGLGVLGERSGEARAAALRQQASAYAGLTSKRIAMAYHLVAVVAQCTPGSDGRWRRRETPQVIRALLDEARQAGFRLVLDIQPGRSSMDDEAASLEGFLQQPDVDLALDPEWRMSECEVPGQRIGQLRAAEINRVIARLERLVTAHELPPKLLILHQFRLDMLPDKAQITRSRDVRLVLNMDGFGSQSLKLASYRAIMRQGPLEFAGIKLFYRQDTGLFSPPQVLSLRPVPSLVVYQ
jgi:hypothetical protein